MSATRGSNRACISNPKVTVSCHVMCRVMFKSCYVMSCYLMLCIYTPNANTYATTSRVITGAWYDQRARKGNVRPQGSISSEGACAELNRLCQGNWVPRLKAGHTQCAWSRGEDFTLLFSQLMWLCHNLRHRLR